MNKYDVISETKLQTLIDEVNDKLKIGWSLVGGLIATPYECVMSWWMFYQAMELRMKP